MWRTTLRNLRARKLRLLATAFAVVLGIAFVSGTLILTDTMRASFDDLFAQTGAGIDVSVRGEQSFSGQMGQDQRPGVPHELIDQIEAVDGVALVDGDIQGYAQLLDRDGEPIGGMGPPTIGGNAPASPESEAFSSAELRGGRWPAASDEVVLDVGTANAQGYEIGDRMQVVTRGPVAEYTLTGVVGFGDLESLAGATLVLFESDTALELVSPDGNYSAIWVAADDGVAPEDLRERVAAAVGGDYEVLTGAEQAASASADVAAGLGFFNTALLVFAGISLFVGAFIIYNTFSIIVAQRTRELALLRAVGASRGQLLRSVLGEAVVTGFVGAVLGLVLGAGVALGLRAMLDAFGLPLPSGDLVLQARTIVVGLLLGVLVTSLSAVGPALKAIRVPPVAALAAVAAPPPPKFGRARNVFGVAVVALGVALLYAGLFAGAGIPMVGAGAAALLIGVAMLSALVTRPIVTLLGWPLSRAAGIRGDLAKQNALRNPRRTASTASALMIGLGLVSFVMIFGASITQSAGAAIDDTYRAEFTVRGAMQSMSGMPDGLADSVGALPEVATVNPMKMAETRVDGRTLFVFGMEPSATEDTLALDVVAGSYGGFAQGGLAIKESQATRRGLKVGDLVEMEFAQTGVQQVPIRMIWEGPLDTEWILDNATIVDNSQAAPDQQIFVRLAPGVSAEQARPVLDEALAAYPTASLLDQQQQKDEISEQVNQLLGLLSALLLLSVVIALFGIVNTLGLSVFERIRELGLLRAIGMSRRQVRAMVRWESVLIAVLGATLGVGIGVLFGWMLVRAMADQGVTTLALPGLQLALSVVAAALAGILAGILPARRASRVDVLAAITAE